MLAKWFDGKGVVSNVKICDGDTIIIASDIILSQEVTNKIKKDVQNIFKNNKVMILEDGMKMGVISKEEEGGAGQISTT